MTSFMRALYVTSAGLWAGGGLLFSAVVLPTLFTNLQTPEAGSIAALLFPGYYLYGIILGACLVATAGYLVRTGARAWRVALAAAIIATACQAYAAFDVRPKMTELRGRSDGAAEFQRLHRLSVRLNGVVLVLTAGMLVTAATLVERR